MASYRRTLGTGLCLSMLALGVTGPRDALAVDPAPAPTGAKEADSKYQTGVGDVLAIQVFGQDHLTGEYVVGPDGNIRFPLIGTIKAVGSTPAQVRTKIDLALRGPFLKDPNVTVDVARFGSQQVSIYGAVEKSGTYYLKGETKLLELLAKAGWVHNETSSRQVSIKHLDGTEERINLDDVLGRGDGNVTVKPGDVLTVFEGLVVYVSGEVLQPQAVAFREGMTVTQALTTAGGPSETAKLRGSYVLRDGKQLEFNLKRIIKGKESDLAMLPGDQLVIKESPL